MNQWLQPKTLHPDLPKNYMQSLLAPPHFRDCLQFFLYLSYSKFDYARYYISLITQKWMPISFLYILTSYTTPPQKKNQLK